MTRLYKDVDGRYYTLKGNTLAHAGRCLGGRRRTISHLNVSHKDCLAIGMTLIANNYEVKA